MDLEVVGRHALLFDDEAMAAFVNSSDTLVDWNSLLIDRYDVRHLLSGPPPPRRRRQTHSPPSISSIESKLDQESYLNLPPPSEEQESDELAKPDDAGSYHNVAFSYGNTDDSADQKNSNDGLRDSGFRPPFPVPESLLQSLRIFEQYKQPFALTYLGISLMVVYLPIAVLKDWICSLMEKNLLKNFYNDSPFLSSSIGLNLSLRNNDMHYTPEDDIKNCLISDMDFKQVEEGQSLTHQNMDDELHVLLESTELSSWEIAKWSIYLTPIWFVTEYLSNSALANTSVGSTTVLTSTSGLFTLFFGALLGQDSINTAKIIAVCISMTGVVMTTIGKTWAPDEILSDSHAAQKVFRIGRRQGGCAEVFWIRWTVYSSWLLVAW